MNVSKLLDRVYRATQFKFTDRFGILDMFNDAQSQLTDDAKIEASSTVTLVVDQENYDLPEDFKAPISLIDGTIANPDTIYPLVNINENQFGYSIYNNEILLKPAPSESKTINFYYYKIPTELVDDTDEPEFDPLYHYLLASYATYMIGLMPEMGIAQGMVDRAKAEWIEGSKNFVQSIARKTKRSRVNEKVVW
jgi:hypothetical protein